MPQEPSLRALEVEANTLFDEYRKMLYEGGTTSVYLWEHGEGEGKRGFCGCYLVKKDVDAAVAASRGVGK